MAQATKKLFHWVSCSVAALLFFGGCGGGASGGAPAAQGSGDGTGGTGGGAGSATGQCAEVPIFPARGFGEDNFDVIRQIRVDEATGDVYFSDLDELFVVRAGTGTAQKIAALGDQFWLTSDSVLFPGGVSSGGQMPILAATSRAGGDARVLVTTPDSTTPGEVFLKTEVVVVGDEVTWITQHVHPATAPVGTTYFVHKTSWRSPGEPQQLYMGTRDLQGIVVAAGKLYVSEEIGDVNSFDYQQKI